MSPWLKFKRVIEKLNLGLSIEEIDSRHLKVMGTTFEVANRNQLGKNLKTKGVLISSLSEGERMRLKDKGVSYITLDGYITIFSAKGKLEFDPLKRARPRVNTVKAAERLNPTLLVSPYGFEILDVLFRAPSYVLTEYRSQLSFCREFDLNQPRLSRIMNAMGADDLPALKRAISNIDYTWWHDAFHYPAARRYLSPFFSLAQEYRSLKTETLAVEDMREQISSELHFAPPQILKTLGKIKDSNRYFWGTEDTVYKLKKKYKLTPFDHEVGVSKWIIAIPKKGWQKEAILSKTSLRKDASNFKIEAYGNLNIFRSLWDLSFGEPRFLEAQSQALKDILNGV